MISGQSLHVILAPDGTITVRVCDAEREIFAHTPTDEHQFATTAAAVAFIQGQLP